MTGSDATRWMWADAIAMIERAERLHRQFFQPSLSTASEIAWEPPVDMFESDQEVWIIAALPGVEPGDLEIYLDANELLITGIRKPPIVTRGSAIQRLEIPYGRFMRRMSLSVARLELKQTELVRGCLSLRLTKQL